MCDTCGCGQPGNSVTIRKPGDEKHHEHKHTHEHEHEQDHEQEHNHEFTHRSFGGHEPQSHSHERVESLNELPRNRPRLDPSQPQHPRARHSPLFHLYRDSRRTQHLKHRHWVHSSLQNRRSPLGQCPTICRKAQWTKTAWRLLSTLSLSPLLGALQRTRLPRDSHPNHRCHYL